MRCVKMFAVAGLLAGMAGSSYGQQPAGADEQQIARDQLRAAVQEICPVSGNKLGAHGAPVKVQIGQEVVFLCCRGCMQGKVDAQHWATIHANFARAQAKCPVMNRALPENAKWTIVEGQIVYVCCPPCTKKIQAKPETYLQAVDQLYAASIQARQTAQ